MTKIGILVRTLDDDDRSSDLESTSMRAATVEAAFVPIALGWARLFLVNVALLALAISP